MSVLREMSAVLKTSIAERGLAQTLVRSATGGPRYLWSRIRELGASVPTPVSDFDRNFGTDTDGASEDTTRLRDLNIASPNWIFGVDYVPADPQRFRRVLSSVVIAHNAFTFIDFGCGKGRAVLLASDYPFQRLIGIDFSDELLTIARANWQKYQNPSQQCRNVELIGADFLDYQLPESPAVLYFYHPCEEALLQKVVDRIAQNLAAAPRPVIVLYLNPRFPHLWLNCGFQRINADKTGDDHVYANLLAIKQMSSGRGVCPPFEVES